MKRVLKKAIDFLITSLSDKESKFYLFFTKRKKRKNTLIELREVLIGMDLGEKK